MGLGKTIEAGLLLAQKWAERKRRLLVIAPANLRKQWSQEMADKFYLPSIILEAKSFNARYQDRQAEPVRPGRDRASAPTSSPSRRSRTSARRNGISW